MKILFLTNLFPPYVIGGAETYLYRLACELSNRGEKIVVVTTTPFQGIRSLNRATVEERDNLKIFGIFPVNLFSYSGFPGRPPFQKFLWRILSYGLPVNTLLPIRNVLREEKPDVVHTHNLQGLPVGVFDLLRSHKGPVVHTIHDYYFLCPRLCLLHRNGFLCDREKRVEGHLESRPEKHICKWYRIFLRKRINGVYAKVIAPSKFILDIHAEFGFCNRTNSEVIPLGSTFGGTLPIARERNKPVSFLFIGSLSGHKGVRILLEAIRKLRDRDAEFHIAGAGDLEEECRDAARKDGRIRFHGFVRGAQKEDLFARCDFLILPSIWYDNSPVVIYEAFSWGMPVIASSIGGIPELVRDGENGFLFEPGSITDLAHRIESCLRSPDAVDFLRVNALRRSAELSFETHINRQLEVYKTLAGGYGV